MFSPPCLKTYLHKALGVYLCKVTKQGQHRTTVLPQVYFHPENLNLLHFTLPCGTAVKNANFIPPFATKSAVQLMAPPKIWTIPENIATPTAISSNFTFSHTPHPSGQGGGAGLLTADNLTFSSTASSEYILWIPWHQKHKQGVQEKSAVSFWSTKGIQVSGWQNLMTLFYRVNC